jgi:hypothetical protein
MNASIVLLYMHQSLIVLNRPLALDIDSIKKNAYKMHDWRIIPPIEIHNVLYSAFLLNYDLSNT